MKFTFGKYKTRDVDEILEENPSYCKWIMKQPYLPKDVKEYIKNYLDDHEIEYKMRWGKYKNLTLDEICAKDPFYISWLKNNSFAKEDEDLMKLVNKFEDN
jgi:uncharacterized protein (DUF3820 family)